MILRYRVSLPGIKGFARVYALRPTMTLYDFHKIMERDMDFPVDQPIQFKALDEAGGLVARYALFDLGAGAVDDVTLEDTRGKGVASFTYFYDVVNRKSVIITFEAEEDEVPGVRYPRLIEVKGPNPIEFENGYVAYEDLPEDQKHPQHHEPAWGKDDEDFDDDDFDDEDE
ncbi:MAG: hypothetical protein IJ652_04800, partial [Bacteroidales bacterium]|nr:hypothetical protein [Bacteroidales bacterium]